MSEANELLRRALEWVEYDPKLVEDIRTYLANQETAKDHPAMQSDRGDWAKTKPAEDEPVAWIQPNHLEKAQFMSFLCRVEPKQRDDFVALYLHPQEPKKPMTEEELANCIPPQPKGGMFHMVDGRLGITKEWLIPLVRAIERHHGIGE